MVKLRDLERLDDRLVRMKRVTHNGDEYDVVDPLYEAEGDIQPVYGHTTGVSPQRSSTELGYMFNPDTTPSGMGGVARRRVVDSSRQDRTFTITVSDGGAPATIHTIRFNLEAGGHIDSWTFDDGTINTQFVNNANSWERGLQSAFEWTDPGNNGVLTRHELRQGGSYYSAAAQSLSGAQGAIVQGYTQVDSGDIGRVVTFDLVPIVYDPDGRDSAVHVTTDHRGGASNPIYFRDLTMRVELWVNYLDTLNVHRLKTTLFTPFAATSAVLPMQLYHALNLREDVFSEVHAWDKSAGDTLLNDGTTGAGFNADYRAYYMNQNAYYGDDETGTGSTGVASANGGVAATGAAGSDLAVFIGNTLSTGNFTSTAQDLDSFPKGNGFVWSQNRDGGDPTGEAGLQTVLIGHGAFLRGRLYPYLSTRTFSAGEHTLESFIITDTWTNVQTKANALL